MKFDLIHGWQDIGRYINRSERTAKRWHYELSMPVYRDPGGRPWALPYQINLWLVYYDLYRRKGLSRSKLVERWLYQTPGDTVKIPKDTIRKIWEGTERNVYSFAVLEKLIPPGFFPEDDQEEGYR